MNKLLFSLFHLPWKYIAKNKFTFSDQISSMSIHDIDKLQYAEFEYYIELLNEKNEEIAKQQKKEKEEANKMQNMAGLGNKMNIPKMNIPKFKK